MHIICVGIDQYQILSEIDEGQTSIVAGNR